MSDGKPATPKEMVWIGTLFAGAGLYFILVGVGVLPIPGGPRNLHAPLWIVACAGLPFFLGGLAVLLQGIGKANARGKLPSDAPAWMCVAQQLMVTMIFAAFAMVGSWIALYGGSSHFSGSFMGFGAATNVAIARIMFGIGAIICWACTIGLALSCVRKLRGMRNTTPASRNRKAESI